MNREREWKTSRWWQTKPIMAVFSVIGLTGLAWAALPEQTTPKPKELQVTPRSSRPQVTPSWSRGGWHAPMPLPAPSARRPVLKRGRKPRPAARSKRRAGLRGAPGRARPQSQRRTSRKVAARTTPRTRPKSASKRKKLAPSGRRRAAAARRRPRGAGGGTSTKPTANRGTNAIKKAAPKKKQTTTGQPKGNNGQDPAARKPPQKRRPPIDPQSRELAALRSILLSTGRFGYGSGGAPAGGTGGSAGATADTSTADAGRPPAIPDAGSQPDGPAGQTDSPTQDEPSASIRTLVETRGTCRKLRWGPRGQQLAFELYDPQASRTSLLLYQDASKTLTTLTNGAVYTHLYQLRFAPLQRGAGLLYVGQTAGGRRDLVLQPGAASKLNSSQDDLAPAWSADGQYVAFTSHRTGKGDIYWFSMKDKQPRRLTQVANGMETDAAWSPSSPRSLLYRRRQASGDAFFLVRDVQRPQHIRLYPRSGDVKLGRPIWSPTGNAFAFYVEQQGRRSLHVMDATSLKVSTLAKGLKTWGRRAPIWSPNGRHLLAIVSSSKGTPQIVAIEASTGRLQRLATGSHQPDTFAVTRAPGGQWKLAFGVSPARAGRCTLYLTFMAALP